MFAKKEIKMADLKNRLRNFAKSNKDMGLFPASDYVGGGDEGESRVWISTGSYAMNKLVSGDPRRGWLTKKIHGLAGEPGVGKSYLALSTAREAIKDGHVVVIYDTEGNITEENLINMGIDPDEVLYKQIHTIEELKTNMVNDVETLRKDFPDEEILVITDSIGMLSSDKEYEDAKSGKNAADMGLKARMLKSASRIAQMLCDKQGMTMIVVNHTYTNPSSYVPEQVFAGGSGFIYACTSIVFLRKSAEKESVKKTDDGKTYKIHTGNFITATTAKNRVVPEGQSEKIYLSMKTGLNKWFGLLEDAIELGFFTQKGSRIVIHHLDDKSVFKKQVYKDEIWNPILDDLSEKLIEKYRYHKNSDIEDDDLNEDNEEVDVE